MIPRRDAEALIDEYVGMLLRDEEADFATLRDRLIARSMLVLRGAENLAQKGRRLLAEGRLELVGVNKITAPAGEPLGASEGWVVAKCRGDSGEVYDLGYDPRNGEWRCTCEARGRCSHIAALQLVVVRPKRRKLT